MGLWDSLKLTSPEKVGALNLVSSSKAWRGGGGGQVRLKIYKNTVWGKIENFSLLYHSLKMSCLK